MVPVLLPKSSNKIAVYTVFIKKCPVEKSTGHFFVQYIAMLVMQTMLMQYNFYCILLSMEMICRALYVKCRYRENMQNE